MAYVMPLTPTPSIMCLLTLSARWPPPLAPTAHGCPRLPSVPTAARRLFPVTTNPKATLAVVRPITTKPPALSQIGRAHV